MCAVLVGAAVRWRDGRRTLSVVGFSPAGAASVVYSKQHLWEAEQRIFSPGDSGASVEIDSWPIGIGVCYDGCFPEHARAASDAGALAYACPSAYLVGSEHRRDVYYAARALDNGIYAVMAGLVGRCGAQEFSGGTAVYDPQGRAIARVDAGSGLAIADLDPEAVAEARRLNPFDRDRPASLGGRTTLVLG
jgi:predicted amidohydrolase